MEKEFVVRWPGNDTVKADDTGLTISRKGLSNAMNLGLTGAKKILYRSITAVQYKQDGAITSGYLQFSVLGGNESTGGLSAATKDENSILFVKKDRETILALKALVEERVEEVHAQQTAPVFHVTKSPAEKIKEFKDLLDAGVISQEEFDRKKMQLLELD